MDGMTLDIHSGVGISDDIVLLTDYTAVSREDDLILELEADIILDIDAYDDLLLIIGEPEELELETVIPVAREYDTYAGPYTVIPVLNNDNVLLTKHKLMADDVTVKPIPIAEVTNPSGGWTVTIG